ncbi:hypothetical protein EVC62_13635 [Salinicola endophyticus]|uniref:ABC transporter substrate-binding protein n=1 Tax=Salinicola endophyticus TaxID=1949083 RepID=A0ABY8FI12_9GAMM|nr:MULTISPECIES: hypothetical protein [Salinicola]WFF42463.1 hypothetical protein EVC62_13635 [Salinicola endophyticus]
MKYRAFSTLILAVGVATALPAMAQSEALKQAQAAAAKVDLTSFFKSSSDARSQSFFFGGVQQHPFTVDEAGRYRFTSSTLPGESLDYRIKATLIDANGNVLAKGSGLGNTGGLEMEQRLEPGNYTLQVSGQKFGSTKTGGNSFNIQVDALDASGKVITADQGGVDNGGGIMFGGPGSSGRTTAFVDDKDDVATLSAPGRDAASAVAGGATAGTSEAAPKGPDFGTANTGSASKPATAGQASAPTGASARERQQAPLPSSFDEIVSDIKVLQQGEVLTFDVAQAGTVSVTSSTFPGHEGSFRLQAKVLDADGRTVASDEGSLADGNFDIETVLQPGRYRVWVKGQRFGSAMNSVNNYTLRVQQLDAR